MIFLKKIKKFSTSVRNIRPVSHVIFDIDGLLLRTEDIYYKTDEQVIAKYGKKYTWDLRMKILGCSEQTTAETLVSELKLPITPTKYNEEVKKILKKTLKEASLMPGAERLVKHLAANNIPIAVATSSGKESVIAKTSKHQQLFKLFHHIVMASSDSEIKHGKPAPDVFLVCAKRFPDNPNPEKCLVFEDSPNGVKAAINANMQVVLVPEEYVSDEDRKLATCVINSLNDFNPELFGLPPFRDCD